ncbi:hypothetical protein P0Y35_08560 [Kiritimatiellaeota bacterium B1221]|nr:hypothetical protein [Kiritimatiellaeota bacterium B1221]
MNNEPAIQMRPWAKQPFWNRKYRIQAWSWARRSGKSFTMGARGLDENLAKAGNLNTYLSASVKIGGEFLKKEALVWQILIDAYRRALSETGGKLTSSIDGLGIDDVCEVFEQQKLECRIWHTNTIYSRSIVVAANPDTAVGYGANLFIDEFGRIRDFQAVWEAVQPFMAENPELFAILASTPPPDDAHFSYEMTAPPPGTEFTINPEGNWYISEMGIPIHRVTADDRYAAGFPLYHPITGEAISPEEDRALAHDKTAWDRNNRCTYTRGGTSAVSLMALNYAMEAGKEKGIAIDITEALSL